MDRHFFNTNQTAGQLLMQFNAQAKTQEDSVLEVLRKVKAAAWFEIKAELPDMNEDSLKRSLSNLKDRGFIRKDTDKSNMVMGPFGKRCHRYVLIESH